MSDNSLNLASLPSFDVAVCVHNALADVQLCLQSVIAKSPQLQRLIIVDDGSDAATRDWLQEFADAHPACLLLRNAEAQGYTKAANRALSQSDAEIAVLLNSDTIVSRAWLRHLAECFASDPRIGIVGPLSNAASWQSVPQRFDATGDWHENPLPQGWDVDAMATAVQAISAKAFPQVPFVNGFCFAIRRALRDRIGGFDAQAFPMGYGEENDFCLRAAKAGFRLAIADHAYVYHAQSRSFTHQRRKQLSLAGGKALLKKHGWFCMWRNVRRIRKNPVLLATAQRLADYLHQKAAHRSN